MLVQFMNRIQEVQSTAESSRRGGAVPPLKAKAERVTFPARIWPVIDLRWRELRYPILSAYVTGLIRYDLMLGGPHIVTGADSEPEI